MRSTTTRLTAALLLTLGLATAAAACNEVEASADDTTDAVAVSTAALEAESDGMALGSLAFPAGALVGQLPATAQERVDAFKAWVAARLTCADATASGGVVDLTFTRDCTWAGKRWTGTIQIAFPANGTSATLTMSGLNVNGATMSGTLEVVKVADQHVTLAADWTTVRPSGRVVEGAWDAEYSWTDAAFTIVAATHELDVDGATSTLTKTGLTWLYGDYAPESGTVTFTGFRGRTWSMVFGRDASGQITVTLTTPNGRTRTYTVDATGRVRIATAA